MLLSWSEVNVIKSLTIIVYSDVDNAASYFIPVIDFKVNDNFTDIISSFSLNCIHPYVICVLSTRCSTVLSQAKNEISLF